VLTWSTSMRVFDRVVMSCTTLPFGPLTHPTNFESITSDNFVPIAVQSMLLDGWSATLSNSATTKP